MNNISEVIGLVESAHRVLYSVIEQELDNYNVPEDYPQLYAMIGNAGEMVDKAEEYLDAIRDGMYKHDVGDDE